MAHGLGATIRAFDRDDVKTTESSLLANLARLNGNSQTDGRDITLRICFMIAHNLLLLFVKEKTLAGVEHLAATIPR